MAENYVFKLNNSTKKTSLYNGIENAVKKLDLDTNVNTEEHLHNVTESRQIRINELAILLSPAYVIYMLINIQYSYVVIIINFSAYISFELCRSRTFYNKTGQLLLNKVHKALPMDIHYKHQVRDIFLYLAKVEFF